jgi:hypothetical protein
VVIELYAQLEVEVHAIWAGELNVRNLNPVKPGCLKHKDEYADCVHSIRMSCPNLPPPQIDNYILL